MKLSSVLAALACHAVLVFDARADDVKVTLTYDVPTGCPDAAQFQDEVAARLGRIPFDDQGAPLMVTVAATASSGWLGTLEFEGAQRVFRNADCVVLTQELAAALAVQLEPPARGPGFQGGSEATETARAPSDEVSVEVTADDPNLTLYAVHAHHFGHGELGGEASTSTAYQFESLCAVPCTLALSRAGHQFAVSYKLRPPVPMEASMRVDHPGTLRIRYRSRSRMRMAGAALLSGVLVGSGLALYGAMYDVRSNDPQVNKPLIAWGGGFAAASLVVSIVLNRRGDRVHVEFAPRP